VIKERGNAAEQLSGVFIIGATILSPWLFGTSETWSTWAMNSVAYAAGVARLAGRIMRPKELRGPSLNSVNEISRLLTISQAGLTFVFLALCLVSVLNARATFVPTLQSFEYYPCITIAPAITHSPTATATPPRLLVIKAPPSPIAPSSK